MYDRNTFRTLLAPAGQAVLRAAQEVPGDLAGLATLRARHPADLATLAHLTVQLRRRAGAKFSRAAAMYFLREALEQATGEVVARHKAARFADHGRVLDLGCGIGGDLAALAAVAPVVGIDLDPLRLLMARENVRVHEPAHPVDLVQADLLALGAAADAFHWDPSRRAGGRRVRAADRFRPPLGCLSALLATTPDAAVSVGPATPDREIPRREEGELEAISVDGECRSLVLWCGGFRTARRRATMLRPAYRTLAGEGFEEAPVDPAPRAHLVVPDPSVVRAHLVGALAARLGAALLDPHIALAAADAPVGGAWTRCFPVIAAFPFSRRRLARELAARGLESVICTRHGVALVPEDLPAPGRRPGTPQARVFLVRAARGVVAVLTAPEPSPSATAAGI
ncbi:MAG: methyltransferase domain-containing protein [Planctomycetes bacterium]|nr:methyltransferase domain-containing protein [Planctomycetota bacterium]